MAVLTYVLDRDGLALFHKTFGDQHRSAMLRASHIEDGVVDRDQEVGRAAAKPSGQRRFAQVFDEVLAHKIPKLPGRDPDTAAATQNLRRAFSGAGHNSPPDAALMGISSENRQKPQCFQMSGRSLYRGE